MPRRAAREAIGAVAAVPWDACVAIRPLHEIPLTLLMGQRDAPPGMLESWERATEHGWSRLEAYASYRALRSAATSGGVDGYLFARDVNASGRGAVVAFDGATGAVVGGVLDGNIHVYREHRLRGLGAALISLAFECGLKAPGDFVLLSPGGRATRRAAHRKAVEAALSSGLSVADDVMADYPDLAPSAVAP